MIKAVSRGLLPWLCLLATVCGAEQPEQKTTITSDRMSTERGENRILFDGNVEARHDGMLLQANHLEVYSDDEKESFTKIVAIGNVRVTKGEHRMEGGRAEMTNDDKKVVVTEDPVIFEKENKISGERIIYSYDNGGIIIEGGDGKKASVELNDPKRLRK